MLFRLRSGRGFNFIRLRDSRRSAIGRSISPRKQERGTRRNDRTYVERTIIEDRLTECNIVYEVLTATKHFHIRQATLVNSRTRVNEMFSHAVLLLRNKSAGKMIHLLFGFVRSRHTIGFQEYPFAIETPRDGIRRIPLATQEGLKAIHFRVICVSLESDGLCFLIENCNLTFKFFKLVLKRIEQSSGIDNFINAPLQRRTSSTAI